MKSFAVVALAAVGASALSADPLLGEYNAWQKAHPERLSMINGHNAAAAFEAWKSNYAHVAAHNAAGKPYKLAMNKFADLTSADFAKYMGFKKHAPAVRDTSKFLARTERTPITAGARKDWREAGVVNEIKDQGQCGSCWAFSAVSAFETAYAISTGSLLNLAEQEVVDCDIYGMDMGCNGGFMDQAFEFIISNGGLTLTSNYKYTAQDGTCKAVTDVAALSGYEDVPAFDEDAMADALTISTLSVAIAADCLNFQLYSEGIFDGEGCDPQDLDHGVAVVAFDTDADSGSDYFVVRNSWGTSWGADGYIWFQRGTNVCGVSSEPRFAIVE